MTRLDAPTSTATTMSHHCAAACSRCSCDFAPGKEWRSDAERAAWFRRAAKQPPAGGEFFHGGPGSLKPGDRIEPPAVTNRPSTMERAGWPRDRSARIDVYVATDPWLPLVFTRWFSPGAVYRVEPEGDFRPDLVHDGTNGWRCDSARVVAVERPGFTAAEKAAYESFAGIVSAYVDSYRMRTPEDDDRAIVDVLRLAQPTSDPNFLMVGTCPARGNVWLARPLVRSLLKFCGGPDWFATDEGASDVPVAARLESPPPESRSVEAMVARAGALLR